MNTLDAHIIQISGGGTSWNFLAKDTKGLIHFFYTDSGTGRKLCYDLLSKASKQAFDKGYHIPKEIPETALISCLDLKLEASTSHGMEQPHVHFVSLNTARLVEVLDAVVPAQVPA